jgi:hypothetical protein
MTKLCPRGKAAAKRKFKVYPSAYANAYASKICAGKIKDPSGVKRKDFRGPKPAAKGAMIKAKNGKLTFGEKLKMQEKGLLDKKTGKLHPAHEKVFERLKTKDIKGMTKTGRNPELGPGKGSPETKLEARSFLERKAIKDRALRAAKATRIGKIAAGVAGVGLAAKAFLNKKLEESRAKKKVNKKKMGGTVVKAALGVMALGLANKKKMQKAKKMMQENSMGVGSAPLGVGVAMAKNRKVKEILGLNKGGMSDYYKDLI